MKKQNTAGKAEVNYAATVRDIVLLKNQYAQTIMDRSQAIDEVFVRKIIDLGIMDYSGRNPRPAFDENGFFQGTDLDLLTFLVPLAARQAVIEIPEYENRRQVTKNLGERKIGANQFGPVTGLIANKDVFSFSVRINDKTIIVKDPLQGKENLGAFRNYMVVDCDGRWYDGWKRIVFDPDADENAFLRANRLFTGNTVYFKYYVHPNRWQSVFGAPYLLSKMLLRRLDEEASFYRTEVNRLRKMGIRFPKGVKCARKIALFKGEVDRIKVKTMEMILDMPGFTGRFETVPANQAGLIKAYRRQKLLTYTWKPLLQFMIRANEAAYFFFGENNEGERKIANWLKDLRWEEWRKNRSRIVYKRIRFNDDFALAFRLRTKTERVAKR